MLLKLFLTVEVHISFQPEVLFNLFSQGITNSLYTALFVLIPTIVLIAVLSGRLDALKPSKFELFLEMFLGGLFGLVESIMGEKNALKYFSFLLTFFIFILVSNWFPLLPGISSIGLVGEEEHNEETSVEYVTSSSVTEVVSADGGVVMSETATIEEEVEPTFGCLLKGKCYLTTSGITTGSFKHMFRAPTADLSAGMALALISVIVTNIIGFKTNKLAYLSKYINFNGPINFVVGILELISEVGKIVSFSFRLFGNIFAGEVLLVVITAISFGVATLPFLGLELFVGVIQALVFFMLTAVFINLAIEHHHS